MKKLITITLAALLAAVLLWGCNTANNADKLSDTTPENESNNGTSNPHETVREVPELGQLKLMKFANYLEVASIWWSDEKKDYYIYINEWDAYRQLPGINSYYCWGYYLTDNCITVNDETAAIAIIDQDGKHDEPTILTYHFNRDNNLIEVHNVSLNIWASSEYDKFFVNMHDTTHGYYFLTPNSFGRSDDRLDGEHEWPLFMFETIDGGKTWNQISTNTFYITKHIHLIKFISPQIGIISARDVGAEELFDRTYLTVDGGLTWNQISQLPHGEVVKWYSNVVDLEYLENCGYYLLTVEASNYTKFQVQLWSKDLKSWTLIED